MTNWEVYEKEEAFYVKGLKGFYDNEDTILIVSYPGGDVDTKFDTHQQMLSALYDLYQTCDEIEENDTFTTPLGNFKCVSVHVVPADPIG
jgi:hypothetical protein